MTTTNRCFLWVCGHPARPQAAAGKGSTGKYKTSIAKEYLLPLFRVSFPFPSHWKSAEWKPCFLACQESRVDLSGHTYYVDLLSDFSIPGVTTMEIVEAGLQVLENEVIAPVTLESIRLMRNRISSIEEDAFRYSHHVKKSHGKHVWLV